MKAEQIQSFVLQYLEAEACDIIEKHPSYVTVKLSPSADKDLTHRPYYWNFVERTGVVPETMTCTFIFDPEGYRELQPQGQPGAQPTTVSTAAPGLAGTAPVQTQPENATPAQPGAPEAPPQGDSILGRYFGFVPTAFTARVPKDELTFGSRRLEQIFAAVRAKGRFVRLFERIEQENPKQAVTIPYETWFAVNYKVEFACDMKRGEIHSLGIQLQTGEIRESFHDWISSKKLTPRLPAHVYVTPDRITLPRAVIYLEEHMTEKLAAYDHQWAQQAQLRLTEEQSRIQGYYESLIKSAEPDKRYEIEQQYANRRQEIEWQYCPRIQISAINCGLFHFPAANG